MSERDYVAEALAENRLRPIDLQQLFDMDIKPREMVLSPIIPEKGLVMIYAARGTGKTHVADSIAYAVSTAGSFLKWNAPTARRVLLVDGEMAAADLRDRLRNIKAAATASPEVGIFQLISGDLVDGGIGNLAAPKIQANLDPFLEGIGLLILDNLSSLTAVIRDNDAESWSPIQDWLLRLRRRGISVLIVHHAGKGGEQRGTSRREDVLDTSISLRRPTDYVSTEGARFEVHIEKGRGIHGEQAKPFEARLATRDGKAIWTMKDIEDANLSRVRALLDDGLSIRDIADETGIKKSTVHNLKKRIEGEKAEADAGHLSKPVSKVGNRCPAVQAPREAGQLDTFAPAPELPDVPLSLRRSPRLGAPALSAGPDDDLGDLR